MKKNLFILVLFIILSYSTYAQDTIEDIEKEIAYLAKVLLEKTGKSSYTLSEKSTFKPVIGACFAIKPYGVVLTCITPDMDPQKKGMKTGDIITRIDDIDFTDNNTKINKRLFSELIDSLTIGQKLSVSHTSKDNKETKVVTITVAQVAYPGFTLHIQQ